VPLRRCAPARCRRSEHAVRDPGRHRRHGADANDLGLNVSFAAGTPSTVTGKSGATVDNSTEATTNTLALKLVGVSSRPNNAIGDSCRWLVRLNRHRYVDQLAGV
jgi:hypothetical protein